MSIPNGTVIELIARARKLARSTDKKLSQKRRDELNEIGDCLEELLVQRVSKAIPLEGTVS